MRARMGYNCVNATASDTVDKDTENSLFGDQYSRPNDNDLVQFSYASSSPPAGSKPAGAWLSLLQFSIHLKHVVSIISRKQSKR